MMKKFFFFFLLIFILFSSCSKNETEICKTDVLDVFRNSYKYIEENKRKLDEKSLNDYYETLSDEEKIGQLFLVSLDGNSKERVERIYNVNKTAPGGYLLFAFNIPETSDETIEFLTALNNKFIENGRIPPFISIDHEGGVVNRLRTICSKLPSQLSVATKFTRKEASQLYELHGMQLRNLGILINLAPVVEVLTDENILFLDDRSYGSLQKVVDYSKAQISGMQKAGVLPVLKHFPGNTNNDPHTGLPVLQCDKATLYRDFLEPFSQLNDGTMTGVLVAHTVVPEIDVKPACLSEKVINLLSEKSIYNGLIFSDDLLMKALIKNGYPVERSLIEAVNAGVNILMISTSSFDEYAEIILKEYQANPSFKEKVDESVKKILEWKVSCNLLERTVAQTGFFEYAAEITLPEPVSEIQIAERKSAFNDAYAEAAELYNSVWWSR